MTHSIEIPLNVRETDDKELLDLIHSAVGPWTGREIERKDRGTLERLALLANRAQQVRTQVQFQNESTVAGC